MSENSVLLQHKIKESEEPHSSVFVLRNNRVSKAIDRFIILTGEIFSVLWALLLAVILLNVLLRYLFSLGMIELEELQWHLFAAAWLVGLSYTFVFDGHVRVDIVHERLSMRTRLIIEMICLLLLFFPFIIFVTRYTIPFVELSIRTNETSTSANGLPARWLIKSFLLLGCGLLLLSGASRLLRVFHTLVLPMDSRMKAAQK